MNVWQFKKMICKELAHKEVAKVQEEPIHPCAISLTLKRYVDREIKDSENGMLLLELLLKEGDKIVVTPRGNTNLLNFSLLESGTEKLTVRAKAAVRKLWEKFSIADAEVPELLYMNTQNVKSLIDAVSDKKNL